MLGKETKLKGVREAPCAVHLWAALQAGLLTAYKYPDFPEANWRAITV